MKPPRPAIIIVILFVFALANLARGEQGTGAYAVGYLFGALFLPAFLAALYVWWYRRRDANRS
jgi:hypothetical protein